MIKNYNILKRHCSVNYTISGELRPIGNLSDNQLDISKRILESKLRPTTIELQQLKAIKYVSNYRSECALKKIQTDIINSMNSRLIKQATNKADIITNWIEKSYK